MPGQVRKAFPAPTYRVSVAESGLPGFDVTSWYGLLAPRAIPNEVRDALFDVTKDILDTPSLQDALLAQGLSVMIETPDNFAARIKSETAFWADVIKTRNIALQ